MSPPCINGRVLVVNEHFNDFLTITFGLFQKKLKIIVVLKKKIKVFFNNITCCNLLGWSAFKILTGTPAGKKPREGGLGNIRMDLEEIGINAGNWVDSAQDRNYWRKIALVNAALNLRVP